MEKKLGIMRNVVFGLDSGRLGLSFTVYTDELSASDQMICDVQKIQQMLLDAKISAVSDLNNKPCWVESDNFSMKFISMMKLS